jgi:hypothetical protein
LETIQGWIRLGESVGMEFARHGMVDQLLCLLLCCGLRLLSWVCSAEWAGLTRGIVGVEGKGLKGVTGWAASVVQQQINKNGR